MQSNSPSHLEGAQTVKQPMEVLEGCSPPIAKPKPATCVAAQTQPSVCFGLRHCGSASRCPRASIRFAHPSGGFGTLAQQGAPIAVCRPGSRRLLGKRCKTRQKSCRWQFFDDLSRPSRIGMGGLTLGIMPEVHKGDYLV